MAFDGVFPAPDLEPTEFGLFAVAKPNDHLDYVSDEKWVRGFSQMYNSQPNYVRGWDETSTTSYTVSENPGSLLYEDVRPIFLEVEDYRSTLGMTADDRFKRVTAQLEGTSQKALEYELWNGEIAMAQDLPNIFLSHPGVRVIGAGTAYSARRALSLLEHYTGEMSPAGEHGVVHLTRDTFILCTSNNNIFMHAEGGDHMQTSTGTQAIIGSGYSGDGPHALIATLAVSGGVATVVTSGPHYIADGETVEIQGIVGGVDFSGIYVADVTNTTTFTFATTESNMSATAPTGTASSQMKGDDNFKWIYATGRVDSLLGEITVVNDNLAQGYDVSGNKNDMRIKASRPAAAYFDPSIHLAVKIDLSL